MNKKLISLLLVCFILQYFHNLNSQILEEKGNNDYFASNVHSGNKATTKFYNNGLVGRNRGEGLEVSGIWPSGTPDSYFGDVAPVIGVEYKTVEGQKKINVPVPKGPRIGSYPVAGFAPLKSYLNSSKPDSIRISMSHLPQTYPNKPWPDQPTWVDENGKTLWNGFFGRDVKNADQESYFVFDDNLDFRPNSTQVVVNGDSVSEYLPNPAEDPTREGLGVLVRARGLQWAQRLAQDNIFWLYEVTNTSEHDWERTAFGMVVGTLVGSEGDSNDDFANFILGEEITYSEDRDDKTNAQWVNVSATRKIGVVGYAFLEAPGNSVDGIDNDGDSESSDTPLFTFADVDTTNFGYHAIGDGANKIILITQQGSGQTKKLMRNVFELTDTTNVVSQGKTYTVYPQMLVGEILNDQIDNDFDGLIDESFELNYDKRIISGKNPSKFINYFSGAGLGDPLVDERRDDELDNDNDWTSDDDVGADGLGPADPGYPGSDEGENDGVPTIGEPHFDKTDITESDQIGLTSFDLFKANEIAMSQKDLLWQAMSPGFFDKNVNIADDWDFLYGAGYAPLDAKKINRFSVSLLYGENQDDIRRNKDIVQKIYDENYRFAQAPLKPTLWAYAGNGKVTLFWDRVAEESYDTFFKVNDFEGYRLYRSTDPNFRDIFTGTDAFGTKTFNIPIAQWDLNNSISGASPYVDDNGTGFFLGKNTGLTHSFVDSGLVNGVTYYYAITAYDIGGEIEGLVIPPTENSISISAIDGKIISLDKNTVVVTPTQPNPGFIEAEVGEIKHVRGTSSAEVVAKVLNSSDYREPRKYRFEFYSQESDGIDNDNDWKRWTDLNGNKVYDFGIDFANDDIGADGDSLVFDADGTQGNGKPDAGIKGSTTQKGELHIDQNDPEEFTLTTFYQTSAFSVYEIKNSTTDTLVFKDTDVPNILENSENKVNFYNGLEFFVRNPAKVDFDPVGSSWNFPEDSTTTPIGAALFNSGSLVGTSLSYDYEIEFGLIDTSVTFGSALSKVVNFKVRNIDLNKDATFVFVDANPDANENPKGFLNNDKIIIRDINPVDGQEVFSWVFTSYYNSVKHQLPKAGEIWTFKTKKPLHGGEANVRADVGDVYEISVEASKTDLEIAKNSLDKIKVVPNPYVANSIFDKPHIEKSIGRERRIRFIHLPSSCTIRIYSVAGDLVQTLEHSGFSEDGDEEWNLRNKNNQDVAFGLYFFHVDAGNLGKTKGKFALIK
ncbi:hypothetical protein IT568_06285 [bacterium]|nr:hypothetical protein [bacterium]